MSVFKNITFGFLFLTVSFVTNAQNFQKVYPLNGRLSLFNAIKVETSEYLLTGSLGPINSNQVLGSVVKLSSEGDVDLIEIIGDSNEIHFLGFSHADILRIDDSSSICWHIVSKPNQLSSEYIFHINSDGESTWSSLDTALSQLSISQINGSDNYWHALTNSMLTLVVIEKYSNSNVQSVGVMVSKMGKYHELDWRNFILNPPGRYYSTAGIYAKANKIEAVYSDLYLAPNLTGSNSKIHFVELDTNGNILRDRIFQPHPFTQAASGVQLVNNGQNYLMTYSESKQAFYAGQNTVIIRPLVALLDTSLNVVWSKPIANHFRSHALGIEYAGYCPKDYLVDPLDSTFIFAHTYFDSLDTPIGGQIVEKAHLMNGERIWRRKYSYYPNPENCCFTELYDASFVPWDSGYVFVGTSYNYDSLGAGVPGQLGYVLKTNCLGHLGDPIAGASYTFNDSLGVHFQSTSIQDGSVTWHFGDGVTKTRGEYQDSVFHQYDSAGVQQVMLVAHGCLGVKDTLLFTIEIPAYTPPIDTTETPQNPTVVYTKTLAIGPNPAITGEPLSVYLGDLPPEGATLYFYDQQGKILQQFIFPQGQSIYLLPLELAAGVYQLVLRSGEKILDKERLVVR